MPKVDGPAAPNKSGLSCAHCDRGAMDIVDELPCCVYEPELFEALYVEIDEISDALMIFIPESLAVRELRYRASIVKRCTEISELYGEGSHA